MDLAGGLFFPSVNRLLITSSKGHYCQFYQHQPEQDHQCQTHDYIIHLCPDTKKGSSLHQHIKPHFYHITLPCTTTTIAMQWLMVLNNFFIGRYYTRWFLKNPALSKWLGVSFRFRPWEYPLPPPVNSAFILYIFELASSYHDFKMETKSIWLDEVTTDVLQLMTFIAAHDSRVSISFDGQWQWDACQ